MTFAQLLIKFRERRNLTKTDLANKLSVSLGYIQHVEAGRRKPPRIELCRQISGILNLTNIETKQLVESAIKERAQDETIEWIEEQKTSVKLVPVISWVHANQFGTEEPFPLGAVDEYVPTTEKGGNMFSLIVKNDCMFNPNEKISFPEGIRIIVDPDQKDLINGKFYVIRDSNAQQATFKQYLKKGKKIFLHPLNPKYSDIELDHDERYEIIGRVVGAYMNT